MAGGPENGILAGFARENRPTRRRDRRIGIRTRKLIDISGMALSLLASFNEVPVLSMRNANDELGEKYGRRDGERSDPPAKMIINRALLGTSAEASCYMLL